MLDYEKQDVYRTALEFVITTIENGVWRAL
jgi:hypothetical protein